MYGVFPPHINRNSACDLVRHRNCEFKRTPALGPFMLLLVLPGCLSVVGDSFGAEQRVVEHHFVDDPVEGEAAPGGVAVVSVPHNDRYAVALVTTRVVR